MMIYLIKIIILERPRQLYVGEVDKPFIPIEKRGFYIFFDIIFLFS